MSADFDRVSNVAGGVPAPFFSICIPQYNRTDFLARACETFASQRFRDFELCIADDCSTDGREGALIDHLRRSGMTFTYAKNARNLRYDGNLRSAIALSRGRYLLLGGNDDGLADPGVLASLHDDLVAHAPVAVAICNYRDAETGQAFRRMTSTGVLGAGPDLAVAVFRRYSFVGGVVLEGEPARAAATDAVDGSEMYQMYLGTRLVAAGGRFLAIDRVCVDMGLQIPGQVVDSYRRIARLDPCPIVERPMPLGRLLQVVGTGLAAAGASSQRRLLRTAFQLHLYIYPFWVIEYRRIQSWNYAAGILLGLRPSRLARGLALSPPARLVLWGLYLGSAAASLVFPIRLFDSLRPRLYALAKRITASSNA
jgi:hypothetical protein